MKCHADSNHSHAQELYKADGVDNKEHILDVFGEIQMLRENITDNTDLAFNMLKAMKEEEGDIVDSLTILCSDILEQEKQSQDIFEKSSTLMERVKEGKSSELQKVQDLMMEYLNAIKLSEQNSQLLIEKIIKNFK